MNMGTNEIHEAYVRWKRAKEDAKYRWMQKIDAAVADETYEERAELSREMHRAYEDGMTATEIRRIVKAVGANGRIFDELWNAVSGAPDISRGRRATETPISKRYGGLYDFGDRGRFAEDLQKIGYTGTVWPSYVRDNGERLLILFNAEYADGHKWKLYAGAPGNNSVHDVTRPTREERAEVAENIEAWGLRQYEANVNTEWNR